MGKSKRQRYTAKQRAAAVADVPALGIKGAAEKHGAPPSCVSRWAKDAGVHREEDVKSSRLAPSQRRTKGATVTRAERVEQATQALQTGSEAPSTVALARKAPAPLSKRKAVARLASGPPAPEPSGRKHDPRAVSTESAVARPLARRTRKPGTRERRLAKVYTPSQRAAILEDAAEDGPTAAAEKHGVSRYAIYDWQRKVEQAAEGKAPSPTTGPEPKALETQRDQEILDEWHRHPGLGPSQIKNQLRRKGIKVSVNTARRVMQDAGYRPPKVERQRHDQRFEAVRPNHLWHLDFVQRNIHRANTFTLILIDDFSRYVVGHGVDEGGERADFVIAAFEQAVARHGKPEMVMHDKGSAFWSYKGVSRFTALLTELGIDQIPAEHKEWNGKVEVFNANLHKELFDAHRFHDLTEMQRRLAAHLDWYNHARTHHALGGLLVPADRYYGRVDETLARIEAGSGRDASDLLDLRARCLELFKVTSKGGVVEVWLLGQRLLALPAGARS